jgi:hypothetical protein
MAKQFAWSYSALTGFETCPRQHYEMRIAKAWPDPPGEAQTWGLEVHKHIENRIGMGRNLPTFLNYVEPIIQKLETSKGVVRAEYKLALNEQFKPVEFFANDAWVRAVGDVVKIHDVNALAIDWKTGKYREGDGQMRLQSAVKFATYPHLEKIGIIYAWLQDKRTTVRTYTRDDVPAIWQEFLPRAKRMQIAIQNADFPAKPSGLCRKHCRVLSCEHNGMR